MSLNFVANFFTDPLQLAADLWEIPDPSLRTNAVAMHVSADFTKKTKSLLDPISELWTIIT